MAQHSATFACLQLRCGRGRSLATAIGDIHVMAADTEIELAAETEPSTSHVCEEQPGESTTTPAQFTSPAMW